MGYIRKPARMLRSGAPYEITGEDVLRALATGAKSLRQIINWVDGVREGMDDNRPSSTTKLGEIMGILESQNDIKSWSTEIQGERVRIYDLKPQERLWGRH